MSSETKSNIINQNRQQILALQHEIDLMKIKNKPNHMYNARNEFASRAKIAEELSDGLQNVFLNNVNKTVVFRNTNKPLTSCLQIGTEASSIKNVAEIDFKNGSVLEGLIDSISVELTDEERNNCVPTIGLIHDIFEGVDPLHIYQQLGILETKTQDISYSSNVTTISNGLVVNGAIDSAWLDNEFAKYSLTGHTHEFDDIYKSITRTVVNEEEEEEEITEIKTLQDALDEKAEVIHTHEFSDIYKTIIEEINGIQTTTTKSLQQVLDDYETEFNTGLNSKADINHTHDATSITYDSSKNVKQKIDDILQQIETVDGQGRKLNLLSILFGAGAVAGTAIDGGLTAAVLNLQSQIATLSAAVTALQGANTALNATGNALDAIDDLDDLADLDLEDFDEINPDSNSNWFRQFTNWLGNRFNSHTGYMRASTTDNYWSTVTNTTNFTGGSTSLLDLTGEIL